MDGAELLRDLEIKRLKLRSIRFEMGERFNYLDRGYPSPRQESKTWKAIDILKVEHHGAEVALENTLKHLQQAHPEVITAWAEEHILFYTELLADLKKEVPTNNTHIYIAKKTIREWKKVLAGEQYYVLDNPYLIQFYQSRQRAFFNLTEEMI